MGQHQSKRRMVRRSSNRPSYSTNSTSRTVSVIDMLKDEWPNDITTNHAADATETPKSLQPELLVVPLTPPAPPSALSFDADIARTWEPQTTHFMRDDLRLDGNRRFHRVLGSKYPLPADIREEDRLQVQHYMYRQAFGRLFHAPVDSNALKKTIILDVGCGPGFWTREVAAMYSNATVCGVDMASSLFEGIPCPVNVRYMTGNVLERLPFEDNTFDFVFQRLLLLGLTFDTWPIAIRELVRVTKPGGYIELVEVANFDFGDAPTAAKVHIAMSGALKARGIDDEAGLRNAARLKDGGLIDINEGMVSLPLNWGGRIGELNAMDMREVMHSLKPFLMRAWEVDEDQYFQTIEKAIAEYGEYKGFYNVNYSYGRKPIA